MQEKDVPRRDEKPLTEYSLCRPFVPSDDVSYFELQKQVHELETMPQTAIRPPRYKNKHPFTLSAFSLLSHSPGLMLTNSSLLRTSPPLRRPPPRPSPSLSAPSPPSWGRWGLLTRSQSGPTSSARGQSQVSLENELCVLVLHMMTLFYRLWRSMKQKNLPSWKLLNSQC